MLHSLVATQFIRFMTTGRTAPLLCGCEDHQQKSVGEYVVKLRGSLERGNAGLLCELVGSRLAAHFGILVPEPALVEIDKVFADLVADRHPEKRGSLRGSVGLNFGSKLLRGMTTWPVDKAIPEGMWRCAVDVFAFDALIQNPDRRYSNPNLFTLGDDIFVYDHEMSFSFLLDILPSDTPWILETQRYLSDHAFFKRLKSKEIDLDDFAERLRGLSDEAIAQIRTDVPQEWIDEGLDRIENHLQKVRGHADQFIEQVKRRLS
jgi:hypothetical protein